MPRGKYSELFHYLILTFLILFDRFGRDCIWDLCQAHTPYPPEALQSSNELL